MSATRREHLGWSDPRARVMADHHRLDAALSIFLDNSQVSIMLPALTQMRTVVERLKTISSRIHLSANHQGQFSSVVAAVRT